MIWESSWEKRVLRVFAKPCGVQEELDLERLPKALRDALQKKMSHCPNYRGVEGIFIDDFIPNFLLATIGNIGVKPKRVDYLLDLVLEHRQIGRPLLEQFLSNMNQDIHYLKKCLETPEGSAFLQKWSQRN